MSYYNNSFERLGLPVSQDSIIYISKLHEIWSQDPFDSRGQRADFSGVDLRPFKIGDVELSYAIFIGANLAGMDLSYHTFTGANFAMANLERVDFTRALLDDTLLVYTKRRGAITTEAYLKGAIFELEGGV